MASPTSQEIAYLRANGFGGTNLVAGTEPFTANTVGAVLKGFGL